MALRVVLPLLLLGLVGDLLGLSSHLGSKPLYAGALLVGLLGGTALLGLFWQYYPQAGLAVIGTLTVQPDALVWQLTGEAPRSVLLQPGGSPVTIWYTGYEGEVVGRVTLPGYENFIAVGNGPRQRFWAPDAGITAGLQSILRSWYYRRVAVKEYCQDDRTFLLQRNLSYEQIQAYKQEFGVSLYT